jgi:magnesium transporter
VLPPAAAAAIVEEMDSDDRADVLSAVDEKHTEDILQRLHPLDAADVRRLVAYPPDSAGGLMITEYLSYPAALSIAEVVDDLRNNAKKYAGYDVQYVYVTGEGGTLGGVIRLRDLMLTPGDQPLSSIMIPNPAHVRVTDGPRELDAFFDDHGFFASPVVDADGVLLGVVRRAAVEEAFAEKADRALLQFGGIIGGDELRSMPLATRIVRRLAFLCPNILLNLIAASVVAVYEPTIATVTALAIFLPMLSDMSGCAGNQAVAVSIRELSLGLLKPRDVWHILRKEIGVGVVNGVVLGGLIGLIAWVMRGGQWPLIGVVVGGAMCINSIVAVVVGGTVPLLLKRVSIDPALAASPILTTFTDLCGFFLTLRLATAILL